MHAIDFVRWVKLKRKCPGGGIGRRRTGRTSTVKGRSPGAVHAIGFVIWVEVEKKMSRWWNW